MWEADKHKTAEHHKVKEGELYHSAELCSYVLNTSAPYMFTSLLISMMWPFSDAAGLHTHIYWIVWSKLLLGTI